MAYINNQIRNTTNSKINVFFMPREIKNMPSTQALQVKILRTFFSSDVIDIRTLRAMASMKKSILIETGNALINKSAFKAI